MLHYITLLFHAYIHFFFFLVIHICNRSPFSQMSGCYFLPNVLCRHWKPSPWFYVLLPMPCLTKWQHNPYADLLNTDAFCGEAHLGICQPPSWSQMSISSTLALNTDTYFVCRGSQSSDWKLHILCTRAVKAQIESHIFCVQGHSKLSFKTTDLGYRGSQSSGWKPHILCTRAVKGQIESHTSCVQGQSMLRLKATYFVCRDSLCSDWKPHILCTGAVKAQIESHTLCAQEHTRIHCMYN